MGAVTGVGPTAGEHRLGRVEDHAQAPATGVDDAGVAQHRELVGRPGQRLAGRGRGVGEDVAGAGAGLARRAASAASAAARTR